MPARYQAMKNSVQKGLVMMKKNGGISPSARDH
jgi:hypothetical protein